MSETERETQVRRFVSHEDRRLCDLELREHPDFSQGYGTPEKFTCSCGRVYVYVVEESEGAGWEPIEP